MPATGLVLGLEGTAWNLSAALFDDDLVAIRSDPYRPPVGGIHPREAAQHHAARMKAVIAPVLEAACDPVAVAFSQSFIWTMGTYATPSALGPDTLWTMGFLIQEQMLGKHNWPMASALAVVLVLGVAAVMVVTRSLQSERNSFHA